MSVPIDISLRWQVAEGDALAVLSTLPDGVVQTCVTSPPYFGLRDYGCAGQIGLESTPAEYVERLVAVFREVKRVLRDDGTLWLNLGDSYAGVGAQWGGTKSIQNGHARVMHDRGAWRPPPAGIKAKDLLGIPWSVAFALRADGWWLRQDIIWQKPNPMPESIKDRCTKAHEYLFLLSKSEVYAYDAEAVAEPASTAIDSPKQRWDRDCATPPGQKPQKRPGRSGNFARKPATKRGCPRNGVDGNVPWEGTTRNRRSVWAVATEPYAGAHFAVMPTALVGPCVRAGAPQGSLVLDPFTGSGTVGVVALREGCRFVGAELNPEYVALANERIGREAAQGTLALGGA